MNLRTKICRIRQDRSYESIWKTGTEKRYGLGTKMIEDMIVLRAGKVRKCMDQGTKV
jgi:hypothetical protein